MFTLSSTEVWNYFTGDRRVAAPLRLNFFYDRMGNATVSTVIRVKWLSSWNRIQPVQILYEGKRLHSITISNWYQRILNHLSCQMILGKVRLFNLLLFHHQLLHPSVHQITLILFHNRMPTVQCERSSGSFLQQRFRCKRIDFSRLQRRTFRTDVVNRKGVSGDSSGVPSVPSETEKRVDWWWRPQRAQRWSSRRNSSRPVDVSSQTRSRRIRLYGPAEARRCCSLVRSKGWRMGRYDPRSYERRIGSMSTRILNYVNC